ncbi:MAG: hypothetical protein HC866_00565 [Leptolyngbyaceae cyanobacterium RU_5_1]|nr:hypothetical protein [Leptolyngbyaceae cyanobacterium RU_5_1]
MLVKSVMRRSRFDKQNTLSIAGLLSDAFQVLYMIKNPSTETATAVQELIDSVCKPGEKPQSGLTYFD